LKTTRVKDVMVPLSEYATVSREATLFEAVHALKEAQANFDQTKYRHRAILIYDENNRIVGKVNFQSILRGLEPKYDAMISDRGPMHLGFTKKFQHAIIEQLKLWDDPLDDICAKAANVKVKSFMTTPRPEEQVSVDSPLNEAIHYLVMGHHQSLMVTEGGEVVGILRLTDVFDLVADAVSKCST
jgi:CBS domain-containing protein